MNKLKEYFHFVVVVLGVLLIFPVGYYFLYALPSYNQAALDLEKQKYEEEQWKITENELEKEKQKELLDACITQAELDYNYFWANECKAWKVDVDSAWEDCRANVYSWQTDVSNKEDCKVSTPDYNVDEYGMCLLPKTRSGDVDAKVKAQKDECYRKYPLLY
ncbi:MAG: hypothetical protein WC873_01770 [Candidatus Gracilibacteria bacterium]